MQINKTETKHRSSTEAVVVGASDYLPNTIWLRNFLKGQGYEVEKNIFEQDNESAMRMEKNGWVSAEKSQDISTYDILY